MQNNGNTITLGLLEQFRAGNKQALDQLFTLYRPRILVFLHYKLPVEHRYGVDIEDLMQELFLKAFNRMDSFEYRGPGSFFGWLASMADKVILDHLRFYSREKRDYRRNTRLKTTGHPAIDSPSRTTSTPTQCLVKQERALQLIEAMDTLSDSERELIYLAKIEGLSTAVIAEKLHMSPAAIYLSIHRILKKLKHHLQRSLES